MADISDDLVRLMGRMTLARPIRNRKDIEDLQDRVALDEINPTLGTRC